MSLSPPLTGVAGAFPNTAPVPAPGEPVRAEDVQELGQGLLNQDAQLNDIKLDKAGGTITGPVLVDLGVTFTVDGVLRVTSGGELHCDAGSLAQLKGKTRTQTLQSLTDSNHNLNVNSHRNRLVMRTAPAGNRILTLWKASASPAPQEGDWFEVTVLLGSSAFTVGLQREGSSDYVAVIGDGVGGVNGVAGTVRVQYDVSEWRLTAVGGSAFFGADA